MRRQHQSNKIQLKMDQLWDENSVLIGWNIYTAVVKEFHPLSPEEIKAGYIEKVIGLAELDYGYECDAKPGEIANVMKAGNLTKADIVSELDAHRARVEAALDGVNI
jgi:hypothetical protein